MRVLAVFFAALVAFAPGMVRAFDMGPLNQYLSETTSGAWTVTDRDGAAIFENTTAPGDISYYFVNGKADEEGRREISVDLGLVETSNFSKAGLIYGFEQDPRTYFLFTLGQDQTIRLEYRGPDGWEERMSSTLSGLDKQKTTLTIREDGNMITLLVNGRERTSIGNDRMGRGGVGIATVGIGIYSFRDFQVKTADDKKKEESSRQTPEAEPKKSAKAPDTSRTRELPDGVLHVRPADIIDKSGFKKPIRAASMLIPADWSFDGTVGWVIEGCGRGAHIVFDALSADKKTNISRLPMVSATWSGAGRFNNCLFHRAERAEDMIEAAIDGILENPKIIETNRAPDLTRMLQQRTVRNSALNTWQDHIIATIDHDRFGEKHRASVLLLTFHLQTLSPMLDGVVENLTATALPVIYSGPVENHARDDYAAAQTLIMTSFRGDPEWQARMNRSHKEMAEDNLRTAQNIHKINREASTYIASLRDSSRRQSGAANDRHQRRVLEMLTETQTVRGENGPISMPAGTVWQTGDGSMFVSKNSNFDPNDVGITAKKLQPIR